MSFSPDLQEQNRRNEVVARVLAAIRADQTIRLPEFDPASDRPSDEFALLSIGLEQNDYSGTVGGYRYQFEGEEDLLHLIVTRDNLAELAAEEAQAVAGFIYPTVPPALMWFKPGKRSHHFYLGHDVLLEHLGGAD